MATADSPTLSPRVRAFLEAPLFAAIATTDEDGAPRQAVAWYRLEPDDRILINSRRGRRWPSNLDREPRLALAIVDPEDGNRWVGVTGVVEGTIEGDQAREDICALAERYHPDGADPDELADFRRQRRVTFLVRIIGIHDHLED